jgi:hypothetical protein
MALSRLPGGWHWEIRREKWWRIHDGLSIEDGPHERLAPHCEVCGKRVAIDPYGGASAWVHLSRRMNDDHEAQCERIDYPKSRNDS